MAKQDRRETGGAAVDATAFHVHSYASDYRRHSEVEALNLPLHIPAEQLSEEVRRVVNDGMGKAVLDMQAKAISE
eukprot:1455614-Pleurochrysis_carterae.AAC.1